MADNEKKEAAVKPVETKAADTQNAPAKTAKKSKPKLSERIKKWWREYKAEFKKIVWCPWKTVKKNSILVIVSTVIVSAVIGVLDLGFSTGLQALANLF